MNTNMFALASGLSDHDLLDRIAALAGKERETSAELVAHLAALEARHPSTRRSVMARSSVTARALCVFPKTRRAIASTRLVPAGVSR